MTQFILKKGDSIGIVAASHVAQPERYSRIISGIERRGFKVKTGENLYKDSYGYAASEYERAEDFNRMIWDSEVKMIFFGGGYGAVELLPHIDYDGIIKNPKAFLSYSDGTFILNAIHAKTGITTFHGQSPSDFEDLRQYNYEHFTAHFLQGGVTDFIPSGKWRTITGGSCEGELIGGHTSCFAFMLGGEYLRFDDKKYILFLEDHEHFNTIAAMSSTLACIEQNMAMDRVSGLLFGHYSKEPERGLFESLGRFGERHKIPVAYCDDFGHGVNHAILPIGRRAVMNTERGTLEFI